jgi:hypothetical protein
MNYIGKFHLITIIKLFMKSLTLILLMLAGAIYATAQVNYLNENFDTSCPTFTAFPANWFEYNSTTGNVPSGEWMCAPLNGRNNSPGMDCTGYYNGIFNVDTSFLISPLLNLSSYSGQHVYLHFDSKTSLFTEGGNLSVIASNSTDSSSVPGPETFLTYFDLTSGMSPVFGNGDSSNWVTHEVDLTDLESEGDFYIAFRYGSGNTTGSIWFLDNINTSTMSILNVPVIAKDGLSLKVIGACSSTQVIIGYNVAESGAYRFSVFDMQGREVYKENKNLESDQSICTINNLNLTTGMYLIKMANGSMYATTKVIIP